ncbi:hypothetical protein BDA99DRAFT_539308 [Phascolomyces articulosus]|uniref:Uncharacterized protein n=1 Tax=Phascolomyces articulosus TaxID=60185 RepID=A0AAD5JW76_9FUNG|nr:hypothetical protein BDA99DRAFT_539308 [Phascolomyces articulosus]
MHYEELQVGIDIHCVVFRVCTAMDCKFSVNWDCKIQMVLQLLFAVAVDCNLDLTEEEVYGQQRQRNIHNNIDQVEISGHAEEQQNVHDNGTGNKDGHGQQKQTNNNNVHNENIDGEQSTVLVDDDNEQQSGDLYSEGYEDDDNEYDDTQDELPSDLTENCHKIRTSEYRITSICKYLSKMVVSIGMPYQAIDFRRHNKRQNFNRIRKYDGPQEENGEDVGEDRSSWIIEEFNFDVSKQLTKSTIIFICGFQDNVDTRLFYFYIDTILNHIYLFNHEDTQNLVIKYIDFFGDDYNEERGLKLMRILQRRHSYEERKVNISDNATLWCSTLVLVMYNCYGDRWHAKDDWYKIQETMMSFLLQATKSNNKTDLIVANILHQQALDFAEIKVPRDSKIHMYIDVFRHYSRLCFRVIPCSAMTGKRNASGKKSTL